MLAYHRNGSWTAWTGEMRAGPSGGLYTLAPNAEDRLSGDELAGYGLHRVAEPPVPEGKVVVSWSLQDADGAPVRVDVLEDEQPPVAVASPRQIRLALLHLGLLPAATTWLQAADEATRIEWDYATQMRRDHPMWPVAASALGKTDTDIDNLFALAATL